jgi:hypothetical protein
VGCRSGNDSEPKEGWSDSMGEIDCAEDLDNDAACLLELRFLHPSTLPPRFVVERVRPSPRVEAGLLDVCPFMTTG